MKIMPNQNNRQIKIFCLKDSKDFRDYELLDTGDGEKLERFGLYIFVRPYEDAVWKKTLPESEWNKADGKFWSSKQGAKAGWKMKNEQGESLLKSLLKRDVVLAWAVGCTSNSNTITIVKEGKLYGNGVGQQDRVGAAQLAIFRADEAAAFAQGETLRKEADLENAVAYSDSFFPFPDAVEVLINRGIKTIFSTSGSVNDDKTIELCKQKDVNLILLPDAEARGFYQH